MSNYSYVDFPEDAIKANARRRKRVKKAKKLLHKTIKRGKLCKEIVHLLGLLDRKINGPICRIHFVHNELVQDGKTYHEGTLAYHIFPQSLGDTSRFMPENVVWACQRANMGERMNRSAYRLKHLELFGKERMDRIEAAIIESKKNPTHYKISDLLEMRDKIFLQLHD